MSSALSDRVVLMMAFKLVRLLPVSSVRSGASSISWLPTRVRRDWVVHGGGHKLDEEDGGSISHFVHSFSKHDIYISSDVMSRFLDPARATRSWECLLTPPHVRKELCLPLCVHVRISLST